MQSYLSWERGRKVSAKSLGKSRLLQKVKIDCLATNVGSKNEEEIQRQEHYYNNLTAVVMR